MAEPASPSISTRKRPRQARSTQLVSDILEAAARVLAKEGAHRFTTARVAETAGVSIGSLYQYFPNKAALLFRLQSDEWQETGAMLRVLLEDRTTPPLQRLRALTLAFVRSECAEAEMRLALDDAAPFYRDAPEAQASHIDGTEAVRAFMREALPNALDADRDRAADLVLMTFTGVGKQISERRAADAEAYAEALAEMLCGYVERLGCSS